MRKIVAAADSFKGSLSAVEACRAIAAGVGRARAGAEVVAIPMADGGEGTVAALVAATGGQLHRATVMGPLGEAVEAEWGVLGEAAAGAAGRSAVIEMAAAAGLTLVPEACRNPLKTTTYGVGELMRAAWDYGCREILIGIGGSATNDGGTGMAQALGVRFFDREGRQITEWMTGERAGLVRRVDTSKLDSLREAHAVRVTAACDVRNPLLGPEGASRIYARQKGADDAAIEQLERNMTQVIEVIEAATGRRVRDVPGAGAAGGLGAGLMAFLGARLARGIDLVMEYCRFAERIAGADLIITGEGKVDGSTAYGKTVAGIVDAARRQGIPVVVLAGCLGEGVEKVRALGVERIVEIKPEGMSVADAMARAEELLAEAARTVVSQRWG